jgi:hypothetical protein
MVPQAFLPKIFIARDRNGEFLSILHNTMKTISISIDYPIGMILAFMVFKIVFGVFRGVEILAAKRILNRRIIFPAPLYPKPQTRGGSSYRIDGGG